MNLSQQQIIFLFLWRGGKFTNPFLSPPPDFGPMSPASILIPNRLFPLPGLDRLTGWKGSKECVDGLMSVIEPMIQAHKGALEEEEEEEHQDMRDFTDTYLKNVRECNEPSSSFFK